MHIELKEKYISSIILSLLSIIITSAFFCLISSDFGNFLIVLLGCISIGICFFKKGISSQIPFILFIFLYTVCCIPSFVFNHNMNFIEFFWPLGFMSIGLILLNFKLSLLFTKINFYIYSFIILLLALLNNGVDNFVTSSSRNTISVHMLLFLIYIYIAAFQNKKHVDVGIIITFVLICVISIGRSGILTACFVLLFYLIFESNNNKIKIRRGGIIFPTFLFLAIGLLIILLIFPSVFSDSINNFLKRGFRSSRVQLWHDYINKTFSSFGNFIFGSSIEGTEMMDRFPSNLHNSFLMLHAKYGILGVLFILMLLFCSCIKIKNNYTTVLYIPLILMLFRMNFDYTNFNGMLDVAMVFFLLYPFYSVRNQYGCYR